MNVFRTTPVSSRIVVLALLTLAFLIPLKIVKDVILERQLYENEAVASVSAGWADAQTVFGPCPDRALYG